MIIAIQRRIKTKWLIIGLALLISMLGTLGGLRVAHALGVVGPDPADFVCAANCTNGADEFEVTAANSPNVVITHTDVYLYFTNNTGAGKYVDVYDDDLCVPFNGANANNNGDYRGTGNDYRDIAFTRGTPAWNTGSGVANRVTQYTAGGNTVYGHYSANANCKDTFQKLNIANGDLTHLANTNFYYVKFVAQAVAGATGEWQNGFRLTLGGSGAAYVGYDSGQAADQFGLSREKPSSGYNQLHLYFGTPCNITTNTTAYGYTFDDDNGDPVIQNGTDMTNELDYTAPNGTTGSVPLTFTGYTKLVTVGTNKYEVFSGSQHTVRMSFTAKPGYKYDWHWTGIYYINVLQFELPFDSIYYEATCQAAQPYTLTPLVTATVTGPGAVGNFAEPGDTIKFNYSVQDTGGNSAATTCTTYYNILAGYQTAQTPARQGTANSPPLCTNQVFTGGTTTNLNPPWNVPSADIVANKTICSSLYVDPGSGTSTGPGPAVGDEACVNVVLQPYVRVYGGDVSAGNGQPAATCNDYGNASIAAWNNSLGVYNGAGTQYAALALGGIYDFAAAQSGGVGVSPAPNGLAFANTVAPSGDLYGGSVGAAAEPCIQAYYNPPSGSHTFNNNNISVANIYALGGSGAYVYTGASTLTLTGGTLPAGARIQVFVPNHNVYISGSIKYANGWATVADIPMFQLVVNGANIYINNTVNEVDGTYVALNKQANGQDTTSGQIATCALSSAGPAAQDNNLYGNCNTQLIVNGAFVADDVLLERTSGTLSSSNGDNPATLSSSAAEQFNYGPSDWMAQPPTPAGPLTYNTIVDLPPVL